MQTTLAIALTGMVFSALWASAFVVGKVAITFVDPISLLCARFAVAGAFMLLWAMFSSGARILWRRQLLVHCLVLGLFNNALYLGLSFAGLATVAPEVTVLIVSTAPFLTTAIAVALGAPLSLMQLLGAGVGFAGVALVLSARMQTGSADLVGVLLIFAGTLSFSLGTVFYRMRAIHHDPVLLNGLQNIIASGMLLPFAQQPIAVFDAIREMAFLLSFVHLVVAVSIIDFLIWLYLVRKTGAAHASSFHLLNPVFGVFISAAVLHTKILFTDLVGTAVVMLGLLLVVMDSNRRGDK